MERIFAVVALVLGMATFSLFVSIVTDMMFIVRRSRQNQVELRRRVQRFFERYDVSLDLVVSAKKHLEERGRGQDDWLEDRELLKVLPLQLQKAIFMEARISSVGKHYFFYWIKVSHITAMRDLCHTAFTSMLRLAGESVFQVGDACQQMFFVESGELKYIRPFLARSPAVMSCDTPPLRDSGGSNVEKLFGERLTRCHWVGEPALWIRGWQNRGDLIAGADCSMLSLESGTLAQVIHVYPMTHFEVCLYAKLFLQHLQSMPWGLISDTWRMDSWEPSRSRHEASSQHTTSED